MTVRLYDTRAQALRDFAPRDPSNVTMYVCGPTVQSSPHIGHVRAAVGFDVLRRWLTYRFGRVTFVRNVTDIDDKILANATDREPWWALAYRIELEFTRAYDAVGVLPPTYEPRATASIPQMIELIQTLIDRGHAYPAPDASGDVYFDVRSWPEYGSLTRQSLAAMEAATDAQPRGKRDPRDFALWKGAKADEPVDASWVSPWGSGRPGWHIECSAMSRRYLGGEFDIHGGGLDLRFPHHENELAQSTAAGDAFARYWVHNGLVTVGDQKMSKSLGNFKTAAEVLRRWRGRNVVRYALASSHYGSILELTDDSFQDAEKAVARIERFLGSSKQFGSSVASRGPIDDEFAHHMDNNLNVPGALAVVHSLVTEGNRRMSDVDGGQAVLSIAAEVRAMMNVLGFAVRAKTGRAASSFVRQVERLVAERESARQDRDWVRADLIRDELNDLNVDVIDTSDGTKWSRRG